jgi:hypothetical protein
VRAFHVEETFPDHPKVVALDDGPCRGDAIALWVLAGAWVAKWSLEGLVPRAQVRRFAFKPKAADELVRVGLWVEVSEGYRFHDWLDRNPTRQKIEAERTRTATRVRAHRRRKRDPDVTPDVTALHPPHVTPSETGRVTQHVTPDVTALHTVNSGDQRSETSALLRSSASQGNSAEIAAVSADLDRARRAATAAAPNGSEQVSGLDAAIVWQRMNPCAGHAFSHWREDFELIASVCNGVAEQDGRPTLALQVVTEWFWRGPSGPIVTGRVKPVKATPKVFAKGIAEDLASALQWWTERKRNGHSTPHEAAE